jgi:hypothetical protein
MNVDVKNVLRVDLTDCYRDAERITVYRSHNINEGLQSDQLSICESDYSMLHVFAMEACAKIADAANYINSASETGLDALTHYPTETDTEYENEILSEVPQTVKLKGESMDSGLKDLVVFGIEEIEGRELIKYTVLQTYIKEAITHYILMKWYHTAGMYKDRNEENALYELALNKVTFNSVVNKKRVKSVRKFRHFG